MNRTIRLVATVLLTLAFTSATAQVKLTKDTIEAPIIGFSFGTLFPSAALSSDNGMHDLYKAPFLNFGVEALYKTKSNWLLSADGNFTMGADNLKDREARMPAVFSNDFVPFVIGTNGVDATLSAYNRALHFRIGAGRIVTLGNNNPNSGLSLRLFAGIMQQKTVFTLTDVNAPQIQDDYARLYDHQRLGFTLTEGIGYWFMSNYSNLINIYVAFEVTQCWNHATRDYVIDGVMNLNGPDDASYFDLIYTLKLCWMFPIKGKTAYDYYFY